MITAVFQNNDDYAHAYGLWQWDYGQQLRIEGLHLPTAVEIHFALQETGGEAIPRVGTTKDGVTTVTIPDSMLEGNGTAWTAEKAYSIYAWVYLSDKSSGETIKRITMQVKSRPKPEAFEAPGDGEIFHEAIEAVNDAAKRAEEAGDKAAAAADDAREAAAQTAEHLEAVQGLAEQVETNADTVAQDKQTVAGMLSQTQQAASEAVLSAQAAKLSETAAVQAQTGAEAAEDTARQYAEDTGADRQVVANDKQAVSQMREDVAADRKAVEQTALQFGQTSQDALTAIGQAQSTAVGAVKAEGNKQTTAVQEVGTQAVKDVTAAKTETVQAVTAEGDKQTKRVEDAAAGLVEGMTDLAPAILNTASGSVISANDATEGRPFRGLRVFGKSTQVRTTGAQLLDLSDKIGKTETKNGVTYIINDDQSITVSGKTGDYTSFYIKNMALKAGTYFLKNELRDKKIFIQLIGDTIKEGVFTLDKDVSNIGVYFVFNVFGGTVNIFNDTVTTMLNEGSTALPWEPYTGGKPSPSPEYPQKIASAGESGNITVEVRGKNLFDINSYLTNTGSEIKEGKIEFVENLAEITYQVNLEAGDYTISFNRNMYSSIVVNNGENKLIANGGADNFKNTINLKDDSVLDIIFGCGQNPNKEKRYLYDIQIEHGLSQTSYEPYRAPQLLTLSTPNGLPGVPVSKDGNYTDSDGQQWVCDEIDLERGKYVQRIEEHILKSKNITSITNPRQINSEYYGIEYNGCTKDFVDKFGNGVLCDKLAFVKPNSNINGHEITYVPGNGIIVFGLKKSLVPSGDLDEIRNYITSNNFAFLILIDSPIEKDLTPEEITEYKKTHTNYPTTVITNDAGAHMEVTYVADTKAYIQNLEQRLSAKLVNIQSALISQKTSGGAFNNS